MKLKHSKLSFKTILSTLILAAALAVPAISAKAETIPVRDQSKVQLYYDDIAYVYHGATSNTIYIKVSRAMKDKTVSILYRTGETEEGKWEYASAGFYKNLDDNYSIYKTDVSGFGGITYKIVVSNGSEEYYDDNNGEYYNNSIRLGAANICSFRHHGSYGTNMDITAAVKNLGYVKDVNVRYTTDNWKSYKEVPLKYYSSNTNYETWSATIDTTGATIDNFEYALSYKVNGQTYWDNNFNNNYNLYFYNEY